MAKDYYNILGVSKSASQDEIKKGFRKLAQQYHPDKASGNEAKFKEINEAYQVVGNPEKRKQYDQFGTTFEDAQRQGGFGGGGFGGYSGNAQGFDFSDLGDLFGEAFGFGGRRSRRSGPVKGRDIETEMQIGFNEAVFGVEKHIELYKTDKCDKCNGNGAEPGTKISTCSTCSGSGKVASVHQTFFGNIQTSQACPDCKGEGKKAEKLCSKCSGAGILKTNKKIKVKIPAGINNREVIKIVGQGEAGLKGGRSGDLFIGIRVKPDKYFRRDHQNIITKNPVSFPLASLGGKIKIKTLEGDIMLKVPPGTQSGRIIKLKGKGVPYVHGSGKGDHLVEIEVLTPENLSKKQKDLLKEFAKEGGEELESEKGFWEKLF